MWTEGNEMKRENKVDNVTPFFEFTSGSKINVKRFFVLFVCLFVYFFACLLIKIIFSISWYLSNHFNIPANTSLVSH